MAEGSANYLTESSISDCDGSGQGGYLANLAQEGSVGIGVLPQYLIEADSSLVRLLPQAQTPMLEAYLAYPEELRNVRRIQVFRDFLLNKTKDWD